MQLENSRNTASIRRQKLVQDREDDPEEPILRTKKGETRKNSRTPLRDKTTPSPATTLNPGSTGCARPPSLHFRIHTLTLRLTICWVFPWGVGLYVCVIFFKSFKYKTKIHFIIIDIYISLSPHKYKNIQRAKTSRTQLVARI